MLAAGRAEERPKAPNVSSYVLVSGALAVVEESPEAAAVEVIQDGQQEALVELEGCRELERREE